MGTGYTTMMYDADVLETGISDIAACQYDGIEMGLEKVRAAGVGTVAEWLDTYDLNVYLVMGEWIESEEIAERMAREVSVAAELGADHFGVLPPQRNRHDDATVERMLETVTEAAVDAGVTPLLHHHGATHVEQPAEIEHFLDAIEGLELVFDTAHYYPYSEHYPEGDVTDGVERFADDIAYVHLKDVDPPSAFGEHRDNLTAGNFHLDNVINYFRAFTDLGDGIVDFRAVREALSGVGFDGHYTIEIENRHRDPLVHAKSNKDAWREIEAASD
jgi:inosose dehydratase